jgi:two-component system sensor histidine kinase YesM
MEEGISNFAIGKLLLQPIIENSMMHGVDPAKESHRIRISAGQSDRGIRIRIEDNGKGISPEKLESIKKDLMNSTYSNEKDNRIGLFNTNQRIRMLFGTEYGLDLDSEEGQGTRVTLDIPARNKEEMTAYV